MSKRLILILALAFVLGLSLAAYAEVQNVKVSGDIAITPISRRNSSLRENNTTAGANTNVATDYSDTISAIISQVRVRIDADLTDNVATTVRLLNERAWGAEGDATTNTNGIDDTAISLDLAYVTLKEFLYSPLTLTLGRQELRFGSGLIIGDPDTNGLAAGTLASAIDDLSLRKSFDAMRATLNYDPLLIDLIYSKIDENSIAIANDIDLFGVNAAYAVSKNLNAEAYFFQRNRNKGSILQGTAVPVQVDPDKTEKTKVLGARGVYTGIKDMTLSLEGAYQFGNHITSANLYPDDPVAGVADRNKEKSKRIQAFAVQAVANYALPKIKYTPTVGGSYTYLSGQKYKSTDDEYRGWNPMFEDQSGGTLYNKILAFTNAQVFNLNGSLKPMEDVRVALNYTYLMLNQPYADGAAAAQVTPTLSGVAGDPTYAMRADKRSLGHEVDLGVTYDYTEDVQFGLNAGAFIPGNAFEDDSLGTRSGNQKTASQVIGSMKVTF